MHDGSTYRRVTENIVPEALVKVDHRQPISASLRTASRTRDELVVLQVGPKGCNPSCFF
ncbi:UNVERIFIED_CONTAM: hypothetical protein Sradi_7131700 [Sesamum radiatum]|uniref:Radical SAM protein n=1 Tax=Sesamum radiatum TaxID=300843 RepID=A0AAW2IZ27_SESRA